MQDNTKFPSEMNSLRQDYLQGLPEKLERITSLHRRMMEGDSTAEVLEDYIFEIHRLAGSAALYGLESVSLAAKELELLLTSFTGLPASPTDEMLASLAACMQGLLNAAPKGD